MFKGVTFPGWTEIVVAVAFVLIAGAFLAVVLRILRTPKEEVSRIAHLPLDDDFKPPKSPQ